MGMREEALRQRFLEKVDRSGTLSECWLWNSTTTPKGYGQFKIDGRNEYAHRVAWILFNGQIPSNIDILHSCNNKRCVNPEHLHLGTQSDNTREAYSNGKMFGGRKLTIAEILEIRRLFAECRLSRSQIATRFGIRPNTVNDIAAKRTWHWV